MSIKVILLALLSALIASCASVDIVKVPSPTQYIEWTDEMQAKADSIEGLRFYLPRPFINVRESFPIYSEVFIAEGAVSPDGQYVVVTKVRDDSELAPYFASELRNYTIPSSKVSTRTSTDLESESEDSDDSEVTAGGSPIAEKPEPNQTEESEASRTSGEQAVTGQNKQSATNDNGAYAYQPMRGFFDIAYLPDFEEQYAIRSKSNLGNAQFSANFGQGWSLQSFNSLSDNSQLNNRVFDLLDAASTVAKAKLDAIAAGFEITETELESSAIELESAVEQQGAVVSLKITIVYYAAPGLYPVLKPRELKGQTGPIHDLFGNTDSPLRGPSAPIYPYQYISFNTFRVMAVEAINPSNDPYHQVLHPTGVSALPSQSNPQRSTVGAGEDFVELLADPIDPGEEADEFVAKAEDFDDSIEEDGYKFKITGAERVGVSEDYSDLAVVIDLEYETNPASIDSGVVQVLIKRAVDLETSLSPSQVVILPPESWMNANDTDRKKVQDALCVTSDGTWGPNTKAAAASRYSDQYGNLTDDQFQNLANEAPSCG